MRRLILMMGLCLLVFRPVMAADEEQVRVFKVLDGDRILVRTRGHSQRVQLAGIDAPERHQPGGRFSIKVLEKMISGKRVIIQMQGENAVGDAIVAMRFRDYDISLEMVRAGAAWASLEGGSALRAAQDQARAAKKGLWADEGSTPIPPWEWRAAQ